MRGNGGGNVSQMIIERLRRRLLGTEYARDAAVTFTYPDVLFHGHMAVLESGWSRGAASGPIAM